MRSSSVLIALQGRLFFVYGALVFLLGMLFWVPPALLLITFGGKRRGTPQAMKCLRAWAASFNFFCRIPFQVEARPPAAQAGAGQPAVIFVGNHRSYYDAVASVLTIQRDFRTLGKKELSRIPLFGWIYARTVVLVDRSDPASRARSVESLKQVLRSGVSVLIFPEGTTNKSPEPLLPFKEGAFRLAIETQTPILPFVILGSAKVFPRDRFGLLWRRPVRVRFGQPIQTGGLKLEDLPQLKARTQEAMLQLLRAESSV